MHHIYRETKARRDILLPHHRTPRQDVDRYDHHDLRHVQQDTPCLRDNPHLHQAQSTRETVHCFFCPHFQGQEPYLNMNNSESDPRAQHHKTCHHHRHERQPIHLPPRSQSPDSSEDKRYRYHTGHYSTQGVHSNERRNNQLPVKEFHPRTSNDLFDRIHRHATPPEQSDSSRATGYKSHEEGCGSSIKAVRFKDDDKTSGYAETHHPNCPLYHTPSPLEDGYQPHRNAHPNQSQSRESRTYRWVWGPPLPVVTPRRGKVY
ncbi:unnamed protein product [Penicillium nalgiovense]|uniref:Uncharacterized protein n=1 Tax=Penicillium nalgiovense TaxID=60175 RepID=A0A9W4H8L9_PENNA|nr:unnamed protein product [Penicillium nalgiovense]CAG7938579.1 unnamed protein product [Penicillium nalgiovense]CAG7940345.1 unnamed protein product [Penicillium nalgiovense]CAG7940508.1 unnamed protein product [Penicillium nalgiovense]CAG7940937.1 unnamed protein product [Penicillium nalgiovense]